MMKRVAIFSLAVWFLFSFGSLWAEDYNPPGWRGDQYTTYQRWEFTDDAYEGLTPDENGSVPPLTVLATIDIDYSPPATIWVPEWHGASGVWRIESPSNMTIQIQNFDQDNPIKEIWMQITFESQEYRPPFVATEPMYVDYSTSDVQQSGSYWNITYHMTLSPNPASETIWIQPADCTTYIDEIVIDTICIPEPATLMMVGLGGLALLRKRRA